VNGLDAISRIGFGLVTGAHAAMAGLYAGFLTRNLTTMNVPEARLEPSIVDAGIIAGMTALAAYGGFKLPALLHKGAAKLVHMLPSRAAQRTASSIARGIGYSAIAGLCFASSSIGNYLLTGAPYSCNFNNKRLAKEVISATEPSQGFCTLLRNVDYLEHVVNHGLTAPAVTVTARPKSYVTQIIEPTGVMRDLMHGYVGTSLDDVVKGLHVLQEDHTPHPDGGKLFLRIENEWYASRGTLKSPTIFAFEAFGTDDTTLRGKDTAIIPYVMDTLDSISDTPRGHVRVKNLAVKELQGTTLTAVFGNPIPAAVVDAYTSLPYFGIVVNPLEQPIQGIGRALVYAVEEEGKVRIRARDEQGREHDFTNRVKQPYNYRDIPYLSPEQNQRMSSLYDAAKNFQQAPVK